MSPILLTAMQQGLTSCEACGLLTRPAAGADEGACPRCGHELHNEKCKLRCPRCHYFMSCSDFD